MADEDGTSESKIPVPIKKEGCKRRAGERQTRYLPEEMFFNFLLHVPAQDLHDVMRYVCREWNFVIRSQNFIYNHLRNSTGGMLIRGSRWDRNATYVELRGGYLEISKLDWLLEGVVICSCNGLVLIHDLIDQHLYVTNPLTSRWTILPPCVHYPDYGSYFGLAFVEASMQYKVVHARIGASVGGEQKVAVLTLGVDKDWRQIDIRQLPVATSEALIHSHLVTGGYVHWIGETFVLTLDVEAETFHRFPQPQLPKRGREFLPMDNNLTFVYETGVFWRDVWVMNSETGEWTMLFGFDLEPMSHRFQDLICKCSEPVNLLGWLAAREVLLFSTRCCQKLSIAYNVKTKEIQTFELAAKTKSHHSQAHVKSLVWFR